MKKRSLFVTKTFWLNLIGIGALVVPGLGANPATTGLILAGLNIANRILTKGPVYVLGDAATEP